MAKKLRISIELTEDSTENDVNEIAERIENFIEELECVEQYNIY